jgi:hypothetical protein
VSFLQNLWRDLVDKRLWPVAIALLVAAVAVPVLMGGGSSDVASAPAPAPAPTAGAVPGAAQVTVAVDADGKERTRAGSARDPFKPLIFAKVAKAPSTAATTGGSGAATSGLSTSAPKTSSSGGSASATSTPPSLGSGTGNGTGLVPVKPAATTPSIPSVPSSTPSTGTQTHTTRKLYTYALTVQLKRSGKISWRHNLQAVSYVPSPSAPLLAFLGVRSGGKAATFLVAEGVQVSSRTAACRPSPESCRFLELEEGDTVLFAKTPSNGAAPKHYRLTLTRVAFVPVSKATRAAAARRTRAAGSAAAPALEPAQQVTRTVRAAG